MSCNSTPCTCTSLSCARHGKCCQCVLHHRKKDQLPACFFSTEGELLHDRNLETFCRDKGYIKA